MRTVQELELDSEKLINEIASPDIERVTTEVVGRAINDGIRKTKVKLSKLYDRKYSLADEWIELWHSGNVEIRSKYATLDECLMKNLEISSHDVRQRKYKERIKNSRHQGDGSASSSKDPVVSNQPSASDAARQQAEQDRLVKALAEANAKIERERKARIDAENKSKNPPKPTRDPADDQKIKDLEAELLKRTNSEREAKRKLAETQQRIKRDQDLLAAKARAAAKSSDKDKADNTFDPTIFNMFKDRAEHLHKTKQSMDSHVSGVEEMCKQLNAHQPFHVDNAEFEWVTNWSTRLSVVANELANMITSEKRAY